MIDDKKYWKDRHAKLVGSMASVGQKSYSEKANYYCYLIVKEKYLHLLKGLKIAKNAKFLDAGSGVGIFSTFLLDQGFEVLASDLSQSALDLIPDKKIETLCSSIDAIDLPDLEFNVVHSFDVLYHILEDKDWKNSLINMCRLSKKYVILHERFLRHKPFLTSKHLNVRTYAQTAKVLNDNGFFEVKSIATHFLAFRIFTYQFSKFFPRFFYKLDSCLLSLFDKFKMSSLGSHHIKVFERKSK